VCFESLFILSCKFCFYLYSTLLTVLRTSIQFKRRSLQELDLNVSANSLRQFKHAHVHVTLIQSSSSSSLSIFINSSNSIQSFSSSLSIFINFLNFIQSLQQTTSASRSTNLSHNAF